MPDGQSQSVQGPDGNLYQFPAGTTKEAAIGYFKKKGIGVKAPSTTPDKSTQGTIGPQKSLYERMKVSAGRVLKDPFNLPEELSGITSGIENYTQTGRAEHPVLSRLGDVAKGAKDFARIGIGTLGLTGGEGFLPEVGAGAAVGLEKAASRLSGKTDPLVKINKLLGAGMREVVPGKTPSTLAEFASNPARGALKAGLDEAKLAKMGPLERNAAIMKAKDAAGQQIDTILELARGQGKTVDIYPAIEKVFDSMTDREMAVKAENALVQLLKEKGVTGPLDKLSPTKVRELQRIIAESDMPKEVSESLRKGFSAATKKAVPEVAEADQHYWDLFNASKGTQKLARQYATKVPENKLRQMIIRGLKGAGLLGAGWEASKYLKNPLP